MKTYGPVQLRVGWITDEEAPDPGDGTAAEIAEFWRYVELYGVWGCIVETRAPACGCCGQTEWEQVASLWGVVGDREYCAGIERELIADVAG